MGERINVRNGGGSSPANRSRFGTRESPRPWAPPRSIAAPTPGEPNTALVIPVTRMPVEGKPVNQDPGVLLDLVKIGLEPKRHTGVVVSATAASAGKAVSTMSTRSDAGRVSGSVTGRPSSE